MVEAVVESPSMQGKLYSLTSDSSDTMSSGMVRCPIEFWKAQRKILRRPTIAELRVLMLSLVIYI